MAAKVHAALPVAVLGSIAVALYFIRIIAILALMPFAILDWVNLILYFLMCGAMLGACASQVFDMWAVWSYVRAHR